MIREVREEDAAEIAALLNAIVAAGGYTILRTVSLEEQRDFIRNFPARGVFHVAVAAGGGQVLGLQDVAPLSARTFAHVGEISTFIAMGVQGQGIGRALMEATVAAARAQGFRKLWATIRGDNPRAVGFYLSQGFRIVGTAQQHAFVNNKYVDEVLAERLLD